MFLFCFCFLFVFRFAVVVSTLFVIFKMFINIYFNVFSFLNF